MEQVSTQLRVWDARRGTANTTFSYLDPIAGLEACAVALSQAMRDAPNSVGSPWTGPPRRLEDHD